MQLSLAFTVYINGMSVAFTLHNNTPADVVGSTAAAPFTVGYSHRDNMVPNSFLNGVVRNVKVYNRKLSAAEVATNYTAAFIPGQGVTDGLVYELRLDEGQGSLLRERALQQHSTLSYGSWSYVPNPRLGQLGCSAFAQNVFCNGRYRIGFNGMQRDDELLGSGNSLDFGARMYDSRLGRFFSTDPVGNSMPEMSLYHFAFNSPNQYIDENGLSGRRPRSGSNSGQTLVSNNPPRDRRHIETYNPPSNNPPKIPIRIELFEPSKTPGGSQFTDPNITASNRLGQIGSLGIELTDAIVTRIKDKRSFVSNGNTRYSTETNYHVRFRSAHNAELFAQMQNIYEAKVREAIRSIPAPGAPGTYENLEAYNVAAASYRFQVARARASLGPSPMQQLLSQTLDNPSRREFVMEKSEELPEIRQGNPPGTQ